MIYNWITLSLDVEQVFLYEILHEEVHVQVPKEMNVGNRKSHLWNMLEYLYTLHHLF